MPVLITPPSTKLHLTAQDNDRAAKAKHKRYGDKHRRARHREVEVGDRVLLKQTKTTTRPPWDPAPYEVTKVKGTQVTARRGSKQRIRNMEKWKVVRERPEEITVKRKEMQTNVTEESDDTDFDIEIEEQQAVPPPQEVGGAQQEGGAEQEQVDDDRVLDVPRRGARQRRAPDRYGSSSNQAQLSPRQRKKRQAQARFGPKKRTIPVRKERWVVREGWQPRAEGYIRDQEEEGEDPVQGAGDQD